MVVMNEWKKTFVLTEDHLKLLQRMYVGWQDCEYGAPEIDPKRPYGNSSVEADVAEILGWPPSVSCPNCEDELSQYQRDEAARIHREMEIALQIVLHTQSFVSGTYRTTGYSEWELIAPK